jgi:Flp pilus assembly protein TadG
VTTKPIRNARTAPRRGRGDDGTVIVESALVVPLLAFVALGMMEYGFLFRQSTVFSSAVQDAARVDSHVGNARPADQVALASLATGLAPMRRTQLIKVIIFRADGDNGAVPPDCGAVTPDDAGAGLKSLSCNVFSPNQVKTTAATTPPGGQFSDPCTDGAGTAWDRFWCPTDRKVSLIDPPDWVGMYVQVDYTFITGVFGRHTTLVDQAVFRDEASLG